LNREGAKDTKGRGGEKKILYFSFPFALFAPSQFKKTGP